MDEVVCQLGLPEMGLRCVGFLLVDCEKLGIVHFDGFPSRDSFLFARAAEVSLGEREFYFFVFVLGDLRVAE